MNRHRTILSSVVILFAALLMQGCKDANPAQPSSQPLIGSWKLLTANGQNVAELGTWWSFTQTQSTVTQEAAGCSGIFNYTVNGDKVNLTVVSDGCDGTQAGTSSTLTYTISGTTLTVREGTEVYVFEKATYDLSPLVGSWKVLTIDGETPQNNIHLAFTREIFAQIVSANGSNCMTQFTYTKSGSTIAITTIDDECGIIEVGTSDQCTYTIVSNRLTIIFSDGTKLIAQRL